MSIAVKTADGWQVLGAGSSGPGDGPNAFGGDETRDVGTYRYHIFTTTGTLAVTGAGTYEVLVIGAGAGGGGHNGGGGGAGAVEPWASYDLAPYGYLATIADGGAGGVVTSHGPDVDDTTFHSLVLARGGGPGAVQNGAVGKDGGSGGGGSVEGPGGGAYGSNTNVGGAASANSGSHGGGGGGGATVAGENGLTTRGGNGGTGFKLVDLDPNLTEANFIAFAGMTHVSSGGGGGARGGGIGTGGPGAGNGTNNNNTGGSATSFGSGGGGGGYTSGGGGPGGPGMSGLVVVRYDLSTLFNL